MVAFIPFFIIGIIITAIGYKIFAYLDKVQKLKKVNMDVPLPLMRESHAVSGRINSSKLEEAHNIAEAFELMCIKEPLKYQDDPGLAKVIRDYRDLLHGKVLDPDGRHIPSETIDGNTNPDYVTYLKAQRKSMKLAKKISGKTWIDGEVKRVTINEKEDDIRLQFIMELQDMGLTSVAISALVSDDKLNTIKAAEWKKLAKKVKEYSECYDQFVIFSFLKNVNDINILLDSDKMDQYNTYISHGAPESIALEIIRGGISSEQAVRAAELVDSFGYNWDKAITEVLEDDLKADTKTSLRDKYRLLVK